MKKRRMLIAMMFALSLLIAAPSFAKTKAQKQAEVRKGAEQTLARLYQVRPSAKATINAAAGYAAFSSFGMKILIAGGARAGYRLRQRHEKGYVYEDARGSGGPGDGNQEIPHNLCVRNKRTR